MLITHSKRDIFLFDALQNSQFKFLVIDFNFPPKRFKSSGQNVHQMALLNDKSS